MERCQLIVMYICARLKSQTDYSCVPLCKKDVVDYLLLLACSAGRMQFVHHVLFVPHVLDLPGHLFRLQISLSTIILFYHVLDPALLIGRLLFVHDVRTSQFPPSTTHNGFFMVAERFCFHG